jgi:hypothetical protein
LVKVINCSCIICKKEFGSRGIYTHFERSHGTEEQKSKYSSGYNGHYNKSEFKEKLREKQKAISDRKLGKFTFFEVKCNTCGGTFSVKERTTKFPIREKYFCSLGCANTRKHSDDTKEKISSTLTKLKVLNKNCIFCSKEFHTKNTKTFCSRGCVQKFRSTESRKNLSEFKKYQKDCAFKFSLNDYPCEFNFKLIAQFGWYSAKNKGNNIHGISRDHIISVKYGYDNGISSKIISHPANCELMQQNLNASKHTKCNMRIEELLNKIQKWEQI